MLLPTICIRVVLILSLFDLADCTASRLYALAAASYLKAHQEALAFLKQAEGLGLNDDKVRKTTHTCSRATSL